MRVVNEGFPLLRPARLHGIVNAMKPLLLLFLVALASATASARPISAPEQLVLAAQVQLKTEPAEEYISYYAYDTWATAYVHGFIAGVTNAAQEVFDYTDTAALVQRYNVLAARALVIAGQYPFESLAYARAYGVYIGYVRAAQSVLASS